MRVLILVAEDNVRELRRLVLTRAGFDVEAPAMAAASQAIENGDFDALVVSRVEEASACSMITAFRRRNPRGRVVTVGAREPVRALADANVDPFVPSELVESLAAPRRRPRR